MWDYFRCWVSKDLFSHFSSFAFSITTVAVFVKLAIFVTKFQQTLVSMGAFLTIHQIYQFTQITSSLYFNIDYHVRESY